MAPSDVFANDDGATNEEGGVRFAQPPFPTELKELAETDPQSWLYNPA